MSGTGGSVIHLLHVYRQYNNSPVEADRAELVKRLEQWRLCLQEAIPECKIKGYLLKGPVRQCIIDVARSIKPQLIIIGKPEKTSLFGLYQALSADEISRLTKCPVLSIANYDTYNKMKTIVLPVRDFVPVRKMELLSVFAKIYRARIFVVAMQKRVFMNAREQRILLETYRVLINGLNNKVEYLLLSGSDFSRAVIACARETGADMLIVDPGKENFISRIFRKNITDSLPEDSRLKILSVVPYHDL
ncbi:hypothetical protein GCM10027043_03840 [Ferruginibacter profundus]